MVKTRRLSDLYVRGVEVVLDDGEIDPDSGEKYPPITVWLQKLNPVEHEQAFRLASAARAKFLAMVNRPESVEFQSYVSEVSDLTEDAMVDLVCGNDIADAILSAEAVVADKEEWKEHSYLQGLRDAWPQAEQKLLTDPDDEESVRVRAELDRFNKQVDAEMRERREEIRSRYENMLRPDLINEAAKAFVRLQANTQWSREFRKCQLWLGTRYVDDRKLHYFDNRNEVDDLSQEVSAVLYEAYGNLTIEPTEVKGSEETPASLPSAEQPKQEETGVSSIRVAAIR